MLFWGTSFGAGTSSKSNIWDRREKFFPRTLRPEMAGLCGMFFLEHKLAFSGLVDWGWGWGGLFLPLCISWFLKLTQVATSLDGGQVSLYLGYFSF